MTQVVALALLLPVLGALLIAISDRAPNVREAISIATAAALSTAVAFLLPAVLAGTQPTLQLVEIFPGLSLTFRVEPIGLLFALVASVL